MPSSGTQTYHHGDLRSALLDAAANRIENQGIEGLSLRKLADDVGVCAATFVIAACDEEPYFPEKAPPLCLLPGARSCESRQS